MGVRRSLRDRQDDLRLLAQRFGDLQEKLSALDNAAKVGLEINSKKTKEMRIKPCVDESLNMCGNDVEGVDSL